MKTSLVAFFTMILSTGAFAQHNYQCIADTLEAYNSDIYYDLTPSEIDELLVTNNDTRAPMVRKVAKDCDVPNLLNQEATFTELYNAEVPSCYPEAGNNCDPRDTQSVKKVRMTTKLKVTEQYKREYTLKTTQATRWTSPSKFVDVRALTIDLGDNDGSDALITVIEADGNNMGVKKTRMVMDCEVQTNALACKTGNFRLSIPR